jgi:hypothetical protein
LLDFASSLYFVCLNFYIVFFFLYCLICFFFLSLIKSLLLLLLLLLFPGSLDASPYGWVVTKGLGARGLGTKTSLAHVITPRHPMFRSAVEVPGVDAIINTLRPQPVVTSVEGRQWLSLPHTTIQIQRTPLISLLDSGSEVTCIDEENFIASKARDTIHTLPVSTSRLVGATGQQSSRIKWQALLEFTISGLTFTNIFLVVKNLIRPVVIGIDWLKIRSTWCWILSNRP